MQESGLPEWTFAKAPFTSDNVRHFEGKSLSLFFRLLKLDKGPKYLFIAWGGGLQGKKVGEHLV